MDNRYTESEHSVTYNPEQEENVINVNEIDYIALKKKSKYMHSVLATQMQKAIPHLISSDRKEDSSHTGLQQMSDVTLLQSKTKRKSVSSQLFRNSVAAPEVLEEYISDAKEELLSDDFVRNLPIPIQEKRHYKDSLDYEIPQMYKYRDSISYMYKNVRHYFEFWNGTLKLIEARHGAAIVAYFLFLRWLLYMNIIIFLLNFLFLISPELLFTHNDIDTDVIKNVSNTETIKKLEDVKEIGTKIYFPHKELKPQYKMHHDDHHVPSMDTTSSKSLDERVKYCILLYQETITNHTVKSFWINFQDFLQGTGPLEPTILFVGSYSPFIVTPFGQYKVSFALLCVIFVTFIICCIMMIRFVSIGIQEAFIVQNDYNDCYSNKVFFGWDYCLADNGSAAQHHDFIILEIKTHLQDDSPKRFSIQSKTKLCAIRLFVNGLIILWLFCSLYLIYVVAKYQLHEIKGKHVHDFGFQTLFIQFLPSITIVVLNGISPTIFDILVSFEMYSTQTRINISTFRNVFLYLSSIFVLLNTMQSEVACKPKDICGVGLGKNCHSPRCWETYVGQQLFRLSILDMAAYFATFICYDLVQYYVTRNFNNSLTRFWGHPIFFLPTEVLAPIHSQTILWLGVLYSPLLPVVMILKLIIVFYIKKVKILAICDPVEEPYRTARFNAIFILILFINFFLVVMVHNFAIESIVPSRGCGPFRYYDSMIQSIPEKMRRFLSVLMSYWCIALATLLLCFTIHYYWRVLIAQKEIIKRLKAELVLQSYDKQYLLKAIAELTNKSEKKIVDRLKIRR